MTAQARIDYEALDDRALAARLGARDPAAVRLITGRNNQRLFRAAWTILQNRAVLTIPRGVPHWFKAVKTPFRYYVVKSVAGA